MKKVKIYTVIAVVCLLVKMALFAGSNKVGTTSCMFKVLSSPKVVALGGAYSTYNDADSLLTNPAGISIAEKKEISLAYTSWLVDTSYSYLSFALPVGNIGSFGLAVNYFSAGNIEETDSNGPTGNNFTASGILTSIVYAKSLGEKISLGLGIKYYSETIEKESASTPSLDIGTLFILNEKLKLGLALQNLFGSIKFIEQEDKLPLVVKLGGSYEIIDNLTSALDVNLLSDNSVSVNVGVEYTIKIGDIVIPVRIGYKSGNDALLGVALGVGFGYKDLLSLNFAWAPSVSEIGQQTFNVGLSFKF